MNEHHFRLDKADVPQQAGQIEAERIVDSTELLVACEQRLKAHVNTRWPELKTIWSSRHRSK
jgi:hypothetical protein